MAPHGRLCVVTSFVLTSASTVVVALRQVVSTESNSSSYSNNVQVNLIYLLSDRLRFFTRQFLVGKLAASDWAVLLALVSSPIPSLRDLG